MLLPSFDGSAQYPSFPADQNTPLAYRDALPGGTASLGVRTLTDARLSLASAATVGVHWRQIGKAISLFAAIIIVSLACSLAAYSAQAKSPWRARHDRSFSNRIAAYVAEAERRFAIPVTWIYGVMRVESDGFWHAISPKGAMGLMQIMPKTWRGVRARYHLGRNPFDPRDNILAGTAYLRELHDLYGSPGDLAAYNAGPGRYEDYRDRHRPLPAETRAYVAKLAPIVGTKPLPPRQRDNPITQFFAVAATLFTGHTQAQPFVVETPMRVHARSTMAHRAITDLTAITPRATGLFVQLSSRD